MRILLFAAAAISLAAQTGATYRVTHTHPLGGEGRWDYVVPDPADHRVYVARETRVMVIDEETGKLIGEVGGIQGAHGTAIVHSAGRGFATSGKDESVVMFDLATLRVLGRIPAAEDADAVIYDPASNRVFTFNGDAHSSTVIDPQAGTRVTNIALGGKPEYGATAGDGKIYANLTDTSEVVEIDARDQKVTRRWSTAPCKQPVSMALDTAHGRLFSGCRSGVMAVSDYRAGKVVATVPIGNGVDGAGYDPASGDAFASNADGTLTVIHQDTPDTYRVLQTIETPPASRNMGLNPVNHRIYLASAKFGEAPAGGRAAVLPGTFALMVIERGAGQAKAAPPKSAQYLSASQIDPSRLLPAPPADGSEIQQHEMAEVRRLIETRTPERLAQAKWDADHEDPTPFAAVLGPSFDLAKLPATAKLLSAVIKDSNAAASAAKEFFHRKFPVAAANPEAYEKWTCDTPARKPGDRPLRSYPSGHTTLGYTLGTVLANLVPENAQAILARAKEYGYSRQICGDHYQSDTEAGHVLGTAIGLELLSSEGLRPMLDAARQELRAAGIAK